MAFCEETAMTVEDLIGSATRTTADGIGSARWAARMICRKMRLPVDGDWVRWVREHSALAGATPEYLLVQARQALREGRFQTAYVLLDAADALARSMVARESRVA